MASEPEIVTAALHELGEKSVNALTDDSDRARLANAAYPITRDAVLRAHPWNFALVRRALAQDATAPAFEFAFSYTLPTDPYCLRVWKTNWKGLPTWKVEGRALLTDKASVSILYISRFTDTEKFDALFTEALIARLAARLAIPVTGLRSMAETMWLLYREKIQEARSIDGQEGRPDALTASFLTEIR